QKRNHHNNTNYLPLLQHKLLKIIKKYININTNTIKINLIKNKKHNILNISITLPKNPQQP
ncbi:cell division topological specificity factor, partial [Escherichia coli]|nr:cell division topological specificity factor [Escherichia coli]